MSPTLAQLEAESYWRDEFVPPTLAALKQGISKALGIPLADIGTRGNEAHLRGGHRSRNWILKSAYCKDRNYTVSETPSNMSGGNGNAISAIDIGAPQALLITMCKRIDAAVRAGKLEKVTEWYGRTSTAAIVSGYNNILNHVASADNSHLTHLHLTFDRGLVEEKHQDVLDVLTGGNDVISWDDDVIDAPSDASDYATNKFWKVRTAIANILVNVRSIYRAVSGTATVVSQIKSKVDAMPSGSVTAADVAAALVADTEFQNLVTNAVHGAGFSIPTAEQNAQALLAQLKNSI